MTRNQKHKMHRADATSISGDESHPRSQSPDSDQKRVAIPINIKKDAAPTARKSTGPRTDLGKKRSSQNSIKFGIFSKATVLEGESRAEYQHLLHGIRESLAPVGTLEESLVDKLATIMWRYKRMLWAEGAEIQKNSKFLQVDRQFSQKDEAEKIGRRTEPDLRGPGYVGWPVGLMWNIHNLDVLDTCLGLLVELRQGIKGNGFVEERDIPLLTTIYGDPKRLHLRTTLHDTYSEGFRIANLTEEERTRQGYPTPAECKQSVLRGIGDEIKRLEQRRGQFESIETERTNLEILRQSVPDSPGLERLLRYSATLERDFDRTLGQLERLQRMRKEQSVAP